MLRLGIDTGGTFTDCVLHDSATDERWFGKTLSTPAAPQQAVMAGIQTLQRVRPFELADVDSILLATTAATNAILERNGARVGLVTTLGFRDVVILGRAKRYDTYDLHLDKPDPLVPRRCIVEVDERVAADGSVLRPLDLAPASIAALVERFDAESVETVAVCLLHAYANPVHEQAIANALKAHRPSWEVSLSSDVSPKYREYERTSTTLANAYVMPVVQRFLSSLQAAFAASGFVGEMHVMQSNGGLLSPELASAYPVNIVESGPAAGVLLGGLIGRRECLPHVLTFDMGGTTAKVGAIENGEPTVTSTFEVDGMNLRQWSGLPLNISAVELIEIGAGGGSIATAPMGIIRVGPASAGAVPGPVCYGRGGEQVTITDANLVLGYLVADRFAGGQMALDEAGAMTAVRTQLAEPLGISVRAAAWGVHAVANANMERAMRSMSIERGRDPRDYAMVAFGGAGPLHACRLARTLGVRQVIVPYGAGVGSAVGMLEAEPRFEASLTHILALDDQSTCAGMEAIYRSLEERVLATFESTADLITRRHVYARYAGQGYELRVEVPRGPIDQDFVTATKSQFHAAYAAAYGYADESASIEVTEWQLSAISPNALPGRSEGQPLVPSGSDPVKLDSRTHAAATPVAVQKAYFPELVDAVAALDSGAEHGENTPPDGKVDERGLIDCPVFERHALVSRISGPAIIADDEATVLIPPGDDAELNADGDLVITIAQEYDE